MRTSLWLLEADFVDFAQEWILRAVPVREQRNRGMEAGERLFGVGTMRRQGFTLVEIMIVVTILGILGALAMPIYSDHTIKAKETAVKGNLSLIRAQIELYKLHHRGNAPGYTGGAQTPVADLPWQFIGTTSDTGDVSRTKTVGGLFVHGPYLKKIPTNPFNDLDTIAYVAAATDFADAADGTSSGWLYKKETGEIRLNYNTTDSKGDFYYTY